jgi:uncharacterized protein YggU (UPF0235/DUF167 family)
VTVVVERRRDGLAFHVIARAGGRKNEVRGEHDGALRVSVTVAPEKGKANAAIVELLAEALELRRGQLALVAGETNPRKTFLVCDIEAEELERRLNRAVGG